MAWTTPMTATANSAFTAAQFNTHVRDNLLETGPAIATQTGRLLVTDGANSIAERVVSQSKVTTSQTTTSTSFTDLATPGPTVTVTTGTMALALWAVQSSNTTADSATQASVAVSGATTIAASLEDDLIHDGLASGNAARSSVHHLFTTLTPGSNTFKVQYRVNAGTGTFLDRTLTVIAL